MSQFGESYAKTGRLDPKYHRWLIDAFDQRIEGDYGFDSVISPETAGEAIEQATEFLSAAEALLRPR